MSDDTVRFLLISRAFTPPATFERSEARQLVKNNPAARNIVGWVEEHGLTFTLVRSISPIEMEVFNVVVQMDSVRVHLDLPSADALVLMMQFPNLKPVGIEGGV